MSHPVGPLVSILLLKTKSTPADGYDEYFSDSRNGHFTPTFLSVLKHTLNDSALKYLEQLISSKSFLYQTAPTAYDGLIFTSQRAVEAFTQAIKNLEATGKDCQQFFAPGLPLFAVGPATARMLRALQLPCQVLGEESGNGEALARFILSYKNETGQYAGLGSRPSQQDTVTNTTTPRRRHLPLLFLVGEKRRDIIPQMLQDGSLPVEELTVYKSIANPNLEETITDALRQIQNLPRPDENATKEVQRRPEQDVKDIWVVFFSPTGCGAVLKALDLIDSGASNRLSANIQKAARKPISLHTAAIGPTTRDYLLREYDFLPDVVAERPSPEGLGSSIRFWQENHSP